MVPTGMPKSDTISKTGPMKVLNVLFTIGAATNRAYSIYVNSVLDEVFS